MVPKNYENLSGENLVITSLFMTIQGEGFFSGRTAVFLRLAGCNLRCSFCDTYFDSGDVLTVDQIVEKVVNARLDWYKSKGLLLPKGRPLLVITGGEPLNQNLGLLITAMTKLDWAIQIESNGLVLGTTAKHLNTATMLIISPKVNEKTAKYLVPRGELLERADHLKFVISATRDGYQDIPQFALDWYHSKQGNYHRLFVSPMNEYARSPAKFAENGTLDQRSADEKISFWDQGLLDMPTNQANHEHCAFIAMKHGATLSLQTHLYASLP